MTPSTPAARFIYGLGWALLGLTWAAPSGTATALAQTSAPAAPAPTTAPAAGLPVTAQAAPVALPADVTTDHWAYRAVRSLFEDYGCLVGYPDGTFRGEQALTRDEFAAGTYACLEAVLTLAELQRAANQAEIDRLIESMRTFQRELDQLEEQVEP
jgi:S-layer homology domain